MAIAYHVVTNFNTLLRQMIRLSEGLGPQPYNLGDNTITYGYGYTFLRRSGNKWGVYTYLDDDLAAVGIELNNSERDRLGKIVSLLNSGNTTQANQLMNQFIADWRYDDLTPDEAQTLFDADMTHQMDFLNGRLRSLLGRVDGDRVYQSLQETREMIGVMSLFYNSQNLVGSGLARALRDGNRAEAWYEIRYGWANNDVRYNDGWAKRRYAEAAVFGLYDDPANMRLDEAQGTFRMLQLHRDIIEQREGLYGVRFNDAVGTNNMIPRGNTDYGVVFTALNTSILAINQALDPAKNVLLAQLKQDNPGLSDLDISAYRATSIYLDPGRNASRREFNPSHNAILDARKDSYGNLRTTADILIGEGGNDVLDGGQGNDILLGGGGSDTYYIGANEGNDTILDSDGMGQILYETNDRIQTLALGTRKSTDPTGQYKSPDGTITYQVNGADLVITTPTNTITVKNFNQGNKDLGIRLIELPAEPTEDTATGPSYFWGVAPPNAAVSSTKTITTTIVSGPNGAYSYTQSPDPLPPTVTDNEILFKSEQVSSSLVTNRNDPDNPADDVTTQVTVNQWYYRGPQTQMIDGDTGNSFSADAVTTLMDGQGGDDTIDGRGVNGITLLGGAGNDTLKNGYIIRGGDGNDFIDGYGGPGFYYGEAGNDFIYYYYTDPAGNSVADGGSGSDLIFGEAQGDNHFIGGDNDDPLDEGDLIISIYGNDFLEGGNGKSAGRPSLACGPRTRVPGVPPITPPSATIAWVTISRMTNATVRSRSRLR